MELKVPNVNDIVLCRVIRLAARQVVVDILAVGDVALRYSYPGIIRLENIRAVEPEKVDLSKCYVPGDIVRAEVVSLGDARQYFLSTAKNHLGVIYAVTASSHELLLPVSWEQMAAG